MVAISGSPSSLRIKPSWTFGRHAAPRFGARLLKSVEYPLVCALYCTYVGLFAVGSLKTPGWNMLQNRSPPSGKEAVPNPDVPHASRVEIVVNTPFLAVIGSVN